MRGLFKGKKGIWRDFLIAMILGLVVVGLLTVYLFPEFFNQDTLDLETCRQSILIRANVPEISQAGLTLIDLRGKYPLKCKTEVINIKGGSTEEIYKQIADAAVSAWSLVDEGKANIFPQSLADPGVYCVPFARIHFSQELINTYTVDSTALVDSVNQFDKFYKTKFVPGTSTSYYNYLPLDLSFPIVPRAQMFNKIVKLDDSDLAKGAFSLSTLPIPLGDIILVYKVYKLGDLSNLVGMFDPRFSAIFGTDTNFYLSSGDVGKIQKYKSIVAINSQQLEELGCSYWDGIPA